MLYPIHWSRLEALQVRKLLQCGDTEAIEWSHEVWLTLLRGRRRREGWRGDRGRVGHSLGQWYKQHFTQSCWHLNAHTHTHTHTHTQQYTPPSPSICTWVFTTPIIILLGTQTRPTYTYKQLKVVTCGAFCSSVSVYFFSKNLAFSRPL